MTNSIKNKGDEMSVKNYEKTVILSAGNKGGIGKSILTEIFISKMINEGRKVLLIEGDASEDGGQPDVAPRFKNNELVSIVHAPLLNAEKNTMDIISEVFDVIGMSETETVIINTPAGSSDVLDKVGDAIAEVCEELNYSLNVAYILSKDRVAIENAEKSFTKGMMQGATKRCVILNDYVGYPDVSLTKLKREKSFLITSLSDGIADARTKDDNIGDLIAGLPMASGSAIEPMRRVLAKRWFKKIEDTGLFEILESGPWK